MGDWAEYKQCHSVLQGLYADGMQVRRARCCLCCAWWASAWLQLHFSFRTKPLQADNCPVMWPFCALQGDKGEFAAYGLLYAAAAGSSVLTHEMKEALADRG